MPTINQKGVMNPMRAPDSDFTDRYLICEKTYEKEWYKVGEPGTEEGTQCQGSEDEKSGLCSVGLVGLEKENEQQEQYHGRDRSVAQQGEGGGGELEQQEEEKGQQGMLLNKGEAVVDTQQQDSAQQDEQAVYDPVEQRRGKPLSGSGPEQSAVRFDHR